jgi:hypothetical protein
MLDTGYMILDFGRNSEVSSTKHSATRIQHPASNIQLPVFTTLIVKLPLQTSVRIF